MILGLETPTSGEIWLEQHPWSRLSERQRQSLRLQYQYVPQDALSALDPQQTVLEHVVETLTVLAGCTVDDARQKGMAMLARLGLTHRSEALPRELSGGEQRRVTLARVLALHPRLVVADEPTSGLDPDRRAAVLQDLVGNLPEGSGCILVTHDLDAAAAWCHRVVVMLEGRVIEELDLRRQQPSHPYTRSLLDPWQESSPGAP
jgi:peptide/nickel transport system ATP-binding protein